MVAKQIKYQLMISTACFLKTSQAHLQKCQIEQNQFAPVVVLAPCSDLPKTHKKNSSGLIALVGQASSMVALPDNIPLSC